MQCPYGRCRQQQIGTSVCLLGGFQFSSVAQSCLTLCDPMNCSTPGLPVPSPTPGIHSNSRPSSRWCHSAISSSVVPLSSCPQIPPSIRVFSNESALCIRWPKYWNFSFNLSPSNEHPGLISFRMDWLAHLSTTYKYLHRKVNKYFEANLCLFCHSVTLIGERVVMLITKMRFRDLECAWF